MIIDKIRLSNFGQHEDLVFETRGASVVGLVGESGKGKSTVLNALKYALTGEITGTAESYMRAGATGKTFVELEFHKGETRGYIKRGVTKTTSSRVLRINNGEEITASKEVNAMMSSILGADKRAAVECVFVPQGALQDLLFADPAEREKVMQRMIGCAHFSIVETAATKEIARIRSDFIDVTAQLSETEADLQRLGAEHDDLMKNMPPDPSERLATIVQQIAHAHRYSQASAARDIVLRRASELANLRDWVMQQQGDLGRISTGLKDSLMRDRALLADKQADLNKLRHSITGSKADLSNLEAAKKAIASCAEAASKVESLANALAANPDRSAELQAARDKYAVLDAEIKGMQQNLQQLEAASKAREQALASRRKMEEEIAQMEAEACQARVVCEAAQKSADAANAARGATEEIRQRLETANAMREAVRGMLQALNKIGGCPTCPVCDSTNAPQREKLEAKDRMFTTMAQDAQAEMQAVIDAATKTSLDLQRAVNNKLHLESSLAGRKSALAMLPPLAEAVTIPTDVVGAIAARSAELAELVKAGSALKDAQDRHSQAQKAYNDMFAENERIRAATRGMTMAEVEKEIAFKAGIIQNLEAQCVEIEAWCAACTDHISKVGSVISDMEGVIRDTVAPPSSSLESLQAEQGVLMTQKAEFDTVNGRAIAIRGQIKHTESQVQSLHGQHEKNKAKMRAVAEMELIAQLFSRQGVAREYMNDYFVRIMELAAGHIQRMGADFTVRPAEGPMAFEFAKTDKDKLEWLPHSKMSGGERVRMGVVFLLALQQIVLPEVGLLVLDEPSTHVSAGAQVGLRDLLCDIRRHMQLDHSQLWVCDHSPLIATAFETKLEL